MRVHLARNHRSTHVNREFLPFAVESRDLNLTAEHAFRTDLERDSSDLCSERAELDDHTIDGVLELEHFTLNVDVDLLGQIALGDSLGDRGDGPDLNREVVGEDIDDVGEMQPGAFDTNDNCLSAEFADGNKRQPLARLRRERNASAYPSVPTCRGKRSVISRFGQSKWSALQTYLM